MRYSFDHSSCFLMYSDAFVQYFLLNFYYSVSSINNSSGISGSPNSKILKELEPTKAWSQTEGEINKTYRYVTNIAYQSHELNMVEYTQSDLKYPFVFVTDLPVSKRNCEQVVMDGRRRWKIENEGFNAQKNHGLGLEHMFAKTTTL